MPTACGRDCKQSRRADRQAHTPKRGSLSVPRTMHITRQHRSGSAVAAAARTLHPRLLRPLQRLLDEPPEAAQHRGPKGARPFQHAIPHICDAALLLGLLLLRRGTAAADGVNRTVRGAQRGGVGEFGTCWQRSGGVERVVSAQHGCRRQAQQLTWARLLPAWPARRSARPERARCRQ